MATQNATEVTTTNNVTTDTTTTQEGDTTMTMLRTKAIETIIERSKKIDATISGLDMMRIVNEVIGTDKNTYTEEEVSDLTIICVGIYAKKDAELIDGIVNDVTNIIAGKTPKEDKEEKEAKDPRDWNKVKSDIRSGAATGIAATGFWAKKATKLVVKKYIPLAVDAVKDFGTEVATKSEEIKANDSSKLQERLAAAGYTVVFGSDGKPKDVVRIDGTPKTSADARILKRLL